MRIICFFKLYFDIDDGALQDMHDLFENEIEDIY